MASLCVHMWGASLWRHASHGFPSTTDLISDFPASSLAATMFENSPPSFADEAANSLCRRSVVSGIMMFQSRYGAKSISSAIEFIGCHPRPDCFFRKKMMGGVSEKERLGGEEWVGGGTSPRARNPSGAAVVFYSRRDRAAANHR
jgi:hypothetical protein